MSSGKLYIVATPIGNLEDITLRALRILKEADLILCEDTRVTRKLLNRYDITKTLRSLHQHSGPERWDEVRQQLAQGKTLALVSDAGTPGINDPGGELIAYLTDALPDLAITPLPGPNAAVAALSVAGFPAERFTFLGFPPHKRKRRQFFGEVTATTTAVVFFESPYRILKTLVELDTVAPDRLLVVCRELTKKFEIVYRGSPGAIHETLSKEVPLRGEFVLVVAPR
ncbi:MAG: 16S rRNA (cytidine(1402)-2'-O)-methyltransferase [bacterium]|nr:16S rRNA (cytidine(1402)-2'-O)-methyltransferase [bacterium]